MCGGGRLEVCGGGRLEDQGSQEEGSDERFLYKVVGETAGGGGTQQ